MPLCRLCAVQGINTVITRWRICTVSHFVLLVSFRGTTLKLFEQRTPTAHTRNKRLIKCSQHAVANPKKFNGSWSMMDNITYVECCLDEKKTTTKLQKNNPQCSGVSWRIGVNPIDSLRWVNRFRYTFRANLFVVYSTNYVSFRFFSSSLKKNKIENQIFSLTSICVLSMTHEKLVSKERKTFFLFFFVCYIGLYSPVCNITHTRDKSEL